MASPVFPSDALAHRLAMEACSQWQAEHGRKPMSVSDLEAIKQWVCTPRSAISGFPSLRTLAIRGIEELIAWRLREEATDTDPGGP
jgi:hypothetical protein